MSSFNRIAIVGYLGRDPELRYTPQGTPVSTSQLPQPRNARIQPVNFTRPPLGFRRRCLAVAPRLPKSICQKAATYGSKVRWF